MKITNDNSSKYLYADITTGMGGKAQEIYDLCCQKFGFDKRLRSEFGMCRLLYASNATPEGYGVWFIAHNNLIEKSKNSRFSNVISGNLNKIYEIYDEKSDYYYDKSTRIVFAKVKTGKTYQYAFIGLYSPVNYEERTVNAKVKFVKIYERIAITYCN